MKEGAFFCHAQGLMTYGDSCTNVRDRHRIGALIGSLSPRFSFTLLLLIFLDAGAFFCDLARGRQMR